MTNILEIKQLIMHSRVTLYIFIALILIDQVAFADKRVGETFPRGCIQEGFDFHHHALTLLPSKAGQLNSVYFIHNNSKQTVRLYQLKNPNQHLGLNINNKIRARQWGLYSTDESQVRFACTVNDPSYEHGRIVDCQQVLEVCEYTTVKYGLNNRGNYWMARSTSQSAAIRRAIHVGVLLSRQ